MKQSRIDRLLVKIAKKILKDKKEKPKPQLMRSGGFVND
jgi:hypothetical protein